MTKSCTQCGFLKETKKAPIIKCSICRVVLNVPHKEHILTEIHKQNKDIFKQVKGIIKSNKQNELMTKLKDMTKHF